VFDYTLEAGDALAWERVSPAHRKRDRLALAASLFAGFGLLQMLSGKLMDVPGLHSLPAALILMALPVLMVGLFQYRDRRQRAKARAGGEARLEVWPDRMIEHRADRREPLVLGGRSLRAPARDAGSCVPDLWARGCGDPARPRLCQAGGEGGFRHPLARKDRLTPCRAGRGSPSGADDPSVPHCLACSLPPLLRRR
jgi:hypothetical protein